MNLPKIAVTLGDPAGVGAEIVLKALADRELHRLPSGWSSATTPRSQPLPPITGVSSIRGFA